MSRRDEAVEAFLRNVAEGRTAYCDEKVALSIEAAEGKNPCIKCPNKVNGTECGSITCLPWYKYYQFRWRRLQRGMLGK